MTLLSALAALATIAPQTSTMTLAGRVVQITYPDPIVRQVPDDVKTWDGFQGLASSQSDWPTPFRSAGDWTAIQEKLSALGPAAKDKPEWKTKIFVLTQTDNLVSDNGLLRQARYRHDQKQVDSILRALARVPGYVRAATNGAVNPVLDVEIDTDPIVFQDAKSRAAWLDDYVEARTNKGRFDAEDKRYRGPFQSTIVVLAGEGEKLFSPYDSQVGVVSSFDVWSGAGDCYGLEEQIGQQIAAHGSWLLQRNNVYKKPVEGPTAFRPKLQSELPEQVWTLLQSAPELPFESLNELYKLVENPPIRNGATIEFPWRPAPISSNVEVSIANDDKRGRVLRYAENSPARSGGFALPYRDIEIDKTPFLSFWAKTTSHDDLGVHIETSGSRRMETLVLPHDGAWHQIVVDLRNGNQKQVQSIYLGPIRGHGEREQVGEIGYLLDDFQLLAQGDANQPKTAPLSEIVKRALAARESAASELVKDPSDLVKLNGLVNRESPYQATDEAALIELTRSANVRIAGEAVKRLGQLGTPTAKAEILRLVLASPFEYVKQVAAIEVGRIGDSKTAGMLSRLYASKSWQTRMAGAQGLTMLPAEEFDEDVKAMRPSTSSVIAMTFLQEIDPQIRLAVTRGAATKSPVVIKRLLWSAVNDPSDAVRTESAWKLIGAGSAKEAAEGYRSIRDDSVGVRLELLKRFTDKPAEGHRGAIRIAVTDLSPHVRAAAIIALSKQPGEVTADEVANTLEDKFPIVQLALLELTKAKSLSLPAASVQSLKASIDPRVVEKARELGL